MSSCDAMYSQIWDIMRAFCKKHPPLKSTDKSIKDAASHILAKESKTVVDFTVPDSLKGPKKQATRFAPNPGKSLTSFKHVLFRSDMLL